MALDRRIVELYDEYTHKPLDRRVFMNRLLAIAGTDKTRVLQAIVWLADMADFAAMNEVWETWVSPGNTPARATGEAKLAAPEYKVEFIITAALPE